jgi:hypothetical protein
MRYYYPALKQPAGSGHSLLRLVRLFMPDAIEVIGATVTLNVRVSLRDGTAPESRNISFGVRCAGS